MTKGGSMLSYMSLFPLIYFFYILIPLGPLVYIFIRWHENRNGKEADPGLGIRVIVHYFKTIGFHLSLIGSSILLIDLISGNFGDGGKTGLGILIGGGLVYLIHLALIRTYFNDPQKRLTAKVYNAFNLILSGLIGLTSMTIWIVIMLGKRPKGYEAPLAFLIVYLAAWLFQSWTFYRPALKKKS